MIKIKFDTMPEELEDLAEGFKANIQAAYGELQNQVKAEGLRLASQGLKTGFGHWERGFHVDMIDEDNFIVTVDGKLASWMEDGIKVGEISQAIMNGNRAAANAADGKKYVDVPITKDADGGLTVGGKSGPKVSVKAFANADQLVKNINTSDYKKGGIKKKQVFQKRVKDIIENRPTPTGTASYLTIRRVTEKSKWPSSPFQGVKVLDKLDKFIDQNIDAILERFI